MRTSSTSLLARAEAVRGHVLEHAHLAEEVALLQGGEDAGLAADRLEQLHRPRLDDVHVVADVALGKDDLAHLVVDDVLLVGALPAAPGPEPDLKTAFTDPSRSQATRPQPGRRTRERADPRPDGHANAQRQGPRSPEVAGRKALGDGKRRSREAILEPVGDGLRGVAAAARAGRNRANDHGLQSIECTRPLQLGQHSIQPVDRFGHVFPEEHGPVAAIASGVPAREARQGQAAPHERPRPRPPASTSPAPNRCGAGTSPCRTRSQSRPSSSAISTATIGSDTGTSPACVAEVGEERGQVGSAEVDDRPGVSNLRGVQVAQDPRGAVAASREEDRVDRGIEQAAPGIRRRAPRPSPPGTRASRHVGSRARRDSRAPRAWRRPPRADPRRRGPRRRRRRSSRRARSRGGRMSGRSSSEVSKSPERACKPNPVARQERLGRPCRSRAPWPGPRSFLWARGRPRARAADPETVHVAVKRDGRPLSPYLALLRMGFTVPPPLPPERCALTAPFHPCRPFGRRFVFCGTFLRVAATGDYPACRPYGVRTFLSGFSGAITWPARSRERVNTGSGRMMTRGR